MAETAKSFIVKNSIVLIDINAEKLLQNWLATHFGVILLTLIFRVNGF